MTLKLGLKPIRPGAVKLQFRTYFKPNVLPEVPTAFGYGERVTGHRINDWGMLANDTAGDCVLAGAAHETMLYCADAGAAVPRFDGTSVLSDYSAVTGYDPADPATDQGTDMQEAASYRQKIGVVDADGVRHKIGAYADLRSDDLALACFLFGAAGVGVSITQSAMDEVQSGMPWSATGGKVLGGHYIPLVGRNSKGNWLFVTWGQLQAATPRWLKANWQGAVAYISTERLDSKGVSPQNYNAAQLNDDFAQIVG